MVTLVSCLNSYEERHRSLDTVSSRYKESTTFEEFATRVYNPIPSSFSTLGNQSVGGAPLAAALIDHHRSSLKGKLASISMVLSI